MSRLSLLLCLSWVSLACIILNFLLYLLYTTLVTNSALTLNYSVLAFQTLRTMAFYLGVFWTVTICSLTLREDNKKKGKREGKEESSTVFSHSLKPLPWLNLQILGYLKEDSHEKYFRCGFTEESLVFCFMMRLPFPSWPKIEPVIVLQLLLYKVYWIHYPLSLLNICPGFSWPQIICF